MTGAEDREEPDVRREKGDLGCRGGGGRGRRDIGDEWWVRTRVDFQARGLLGGLHNLFPSENRRLNL